jgi:hypothetical protein
MDAGNDEAHRPARIDLRLEGEHEMDVASAVFSLGIDRLAIERPRGIRVPLTEAHHGVRPLATPWPIVVRVFVNLAGLLRGGTRWSADQGAKTRGGGTAHGRGFQ